MNGESPYFRAALAAASLLNLAYFGVEFAVALNIGSVSLFADSMDFLEDASVNGLILFALGFRPKNRARLGMGLAALLLLPGVAGLLTAAHKAMAPLAPAPLPLSLTALGALFVNLACAFLLARFRHHAGSLSRAAYLSARNDVIAELAILAAAGVTALHASPWPDLVVGFGIAAINLDAARTVYRTAVSEARV